MFRICGEDLSRVREISGGRFPPLFDSHAHYLDESFDGDREQVLSCLKDFGVRHVLEAACHVSDCEKVVRLCEEHPGTVFGAAGIHPEHASEYSPENMDLIRSFLSLGCMVAVGETGLDYHWDDNPPKEIQKANFDAHLGLASESGKPVLIHDRDAHGDCLDILRAHRGRVTGVMHCFSGSYETARECLDLGYYIGIGGSSTFKNARKLLEIIPKLPLDRILLETDCPYMAPEPFRGHRNDSRYIPVTLDRICSLRPEDADRIASACFDNCLSLFGTASL